MVSSVLKLYKFNPIFRRHGVNRRLYISKRRKMKTCSSEKKKGDEEDDNSTREFADDGLLADADMRAITPSGTPLSPRLVISASRAPQRAHASPASPGASSVSPPGWPPSPSLSRSGPPPAWARRRPACPPTQPSSRAARGSAGWRRGAGPGNQRGGSGRRLSPAAEDRRGGSPWRLLTMSSSPVPPKVLPMFVSHRFCFSEQDFC